MRQTHVSHAHTGNSLSAFGGLTQWQLWFFTCMIGGGIMMVLYWRFGVVAPWADYMTIVIVTLFLGSVYKSYGDIRFLDRETRLASEQVNQLANVNDVEQFLRSSKPCVFRNHIASLHTILLGNPTVEQSNLIEITHARLNARNRVVELLASILITLGLIGTIIGLLLSIGGLSGVLGAESDNMSAVQQEMQKTVQGLSTAFYTTLFGAIFGGVVLRILTSVVEANILRYMAHLAELTEVHVLPAMRRAAARLDAEGYYRRLDGGR
ncbi:MAG TPA: MotA/TolQ/ExbB proton channel family protein [Tepidisphaeraceae bacterium]|nr:MotA/TolQ/ExbB proton channel family protein [Tepidisphaeraceae bacterium]